MKTLDTRDLNDRKIELEGYRDALETARALLAELKEQKAEIDLNQGVASDSSWNKATEISEAESAVELAEIDFGDAEAEELAELEELESQISEWRHGETLILESDFEDYARELAEDCGMISGDEGWPLNCIDWEKAARELAYDYTTVTYQGGDYYVRNC